MARFLRVFRNDFTHSDVLAAILQDVPSGGTVFTCILLGHGQHGRLFGGCVVYSAVHLVMPFATFVASLLIRRLHRLFGSYRRLFGGAWHMGKISALKS